MLKIATLIVFVDLIRRSLQTQEGTRAVDEAHHRRVLQGSCRDLEFGSGYGGSWCAACRACNSTASNGSIVMNINCNPCGRYSFRSGDQFVKPFKSYNSSSYDNIQREFYTDCDFWEETDRCKWRTKCIISQWNRQFDCSENALNSSDFTNVSSSSRIVSNYSTLGLVEANCTSYKSRSSNGSLNFTVDCKPIGNYYYKSGSGKMFKELDRYAGWDRRMNSFYTDCFGSFRCERCWWVTHCTTNEYDQDFGFSCLVFSGNGNYSENRGFYNYSQYLNSDLNANCTFRSTSDRYGNVSTNLTCQPADNYVNWTRDTNIESTSISNYSSEDGRTLVFRSDCWGNRNLGQCFFIASCSKNSETWFGFDCTVYGSSDGRSNSSRVDPYNLNNYTRDNRYIGAACNLTRVTTWRGVRFTAITCAPSSDYRYSTSDWRIATNTVWNQSTGTYSDLVFYTDCWDSYWYDRCGWITVCNQYNDSSFGGWRCNLYGVAQNNSSNGSNSSRTYVFSNYSPEVGGWVESNCTATNTTTWNGSIQSTINCRPNRGYNYKTYDNYIHERTYYNWSSPDGQSIMFTTDCWGSDYYNNCWWITTCSKTNYRSFGWECSVFGRNSSNGSNTTNTTTANRIFSNYSYPIGYMYSNCTATNGTSWNGSRYSNISCAPDWNYTYKTYDRYVHTSTYYNWSAPDSTGYYFSTDCWGSSWDQCWWISTCTRDSFFSSFGWTCSVYHAGNNSSNTTSDWNTFSNYSYTAGEYLTANCTATNRTTWNGSIETNLTCAPSGYTYKTYNRQINIQRIYNWSSPDGQSIVFSTDCWGRWYDDQCHFVTSCTKAYNWFGYSCIVYGKNSSNSSNDTNCANFIQYNNWWEPDWCANCTYCNYTLRNGSEQFSLACRPCRNYSYSTSDYSVHSQNFSNYSSYDNIERRFTSDCGSYGCGWCASALKDWIHVGFNVSRCVSSNSTNVTRNTFKTELGYGIDWCANCSVNGTRSGSRFGGCTPCSSWAPYTNLTCESNITTVVLPGLRWCSNCTTCSNGFQFCKPCLDVAFSSGLKSLKEVSIEEHPPVVQAAQTSNELDVEAQSEFMQEEVEDAKAPGSLANLFN